MTSMSSINSELVRFAKSVCKNAYAPYSKFAVGCAILSENGHYYSGANVENLSFGLTICAERAAVFNGVSKEGPSFRIKELVVYTNSEMPITPCGACLQVLREFGSNFKVISISESGGQFDHALGELLPFPPDIQL